MCSIAPFQAVKNEKLGSVDTISFIDKKDKKNKNDKICINCLKVVETNLRCIRCRTALYCSKKCQVAHWNYHSKSCMKTDTEKNIVKVVMKGLNQMEQGNFQKAHKLLSKFVLNADEMKEIQGYRGLHGF